MKRISVRTTAIALMIAALPGIALAQNRIDARQAEQQKRINAGVASGQINKAEAARLQKGQAHVQNVETRAKADGVVTKKEAAHIEHAQNQQSRKIYREKHDKTTSANRP